MLLVDGRYYLNFDLGDTAEIIEEQKGFEIGTIVKITSYNSGRRGRLVHATWWLDVEDETTGRRTDIQIGRLRLCPNIEGTCKDCINTCRQPDLETCPFKEKRE